MKRGWRSTARRRAAFATVALSLALAGCASTARPQRFEPAPVACADSSLVKLRAVHPDSLSEREWQRLQVLERNCSLARAQTARETPGRTHDHAMWWMGSGLAMALMMVAMWSSR